MPLWWGEEWNVWGERRGAYRVLVWKPDGKRQLKNLGVEGR